MKALALVLSTLVATVLVLAGTFVLVLVLPHHHGGLLLLGSLSITPLVYGPVLIGSLLTYYDPAKSAQSRKTFRRWWLVVVGIDVLAAIGIVVFAIVAPAPVWVPVAFIGTGALLFLIAWAVARPLRRYDERRADKVPAWAPISRDQVLRKIVIVAVTFAASFVLLSALFEFLFSRGRGIKDGLGTALTFGLDFGFIAGAIACIFLTLSLNRQLRATSNGDLGTVRKFGRVVVRGKKDVLSDEERVPAVRYAAILSVSLPFTLAYITLLYAGIITQTVGMIVRAHGAVDPFFGPWYVVALVVILAVIYPVMIVRILRTRRYVREHSDLLEAQAAAK